MNQNHSDEVLPAKQVKVLADVVRMALAPRLEKRLPSELTIVVRIRCVEGSCRISEENITVFPDHNITEKIEMICGIAHTFALNAMTASPPRELGKLLGLDVILKESHTSGGHIVSLERDGNVYYLRKHSEIKL